MPQDKTIHSTNDNPHFAPHLNIEKPRRYNWFHPPKPQVKPTVTKAMQVQRQGSLDGDKPVLERQRSLSEGEPSSPVGSPSMGSLPPGPPSTYFTYGQPLPPVMKSKTEKDFFKSLDFK